MLDPSRQSEKVRDKNCRVYLGFMDLEKTSDRLNKERLWQILRMYDVSCKLFEFINSIYSLQFTVQPVLE